MVTGQSWPFRPSASAQVDYWDLDMMNQNIEKTNKKKKEIVNRPNKTQSAPEVKNLESDMFGKNNIRRLEQDFFSRNKKKTKSLNTAEKILKRIL